MAAPATPTFVLIAMLLLGSARSQILSADSSFSANGQQAESSTVASGSMQLASLDGSVKAYLLTTVIGGLNFVSNLLTTVTGKVVCDVCQDGIFSAPQDRALANVEVSLACQVAPPCLLLICPSPVTVTLKAKTAADGSFVIANVPTAEAALQAGNKGLLSCAVSLGSSPDSSCSSLKAGLCGLDASLKVNVTRALSASADLSLGSLCFTGQSRPDSCSGGVVGDPHFTGGFGAHFDFTGQPGKTYCMVSDAHLHVNMFLDGRYAQWGSNPRKPLTWIRKLAVLWGHHSVLLEARTGGDWRYGSGGFMAGIHVDGEPLQLAGPGAQAELFRGRGSIAWVEGAASEGAPFDAYELALGDVALLRLTVRPEIAYLRVAEDAAVHFDVLLKKVALSASAHGVLGQTFSPTSHQKLKGQRLVHNEQLNWDMVVGENAEGFLEGSSSDYENSGGLLSATCAFSRFARSETVDEETSAAIQGSGSVEGSQRSAAVLPRKFLTA